MKQLIEDLISAMEYHVEQTRPIHMTTVAIQAAKDALKAMPAQEPCDMGAMCLGCEPRNPDGSCPDARSAQEPVAWMWKDMRGQDVISLFEPRLNSIPLYTAPPKREWIELTSEETPGFTSQELALVKYASRVLQEKNNG